MRRATQKRPTTGVIVLLCILCVGSIFGLAYGKLRGGAAIFEKAADAVVENTSASNTYIIYSMQPHLLTPVGGHGLTGKGGGKTPTAPGVTPPPSQGGSTPTATSTAPQGGPPPPPNSGTTLPPGSALPSESACAGRVSYSSFEPRPDNYSANHSVPTSAQIAGLQPWTPTIGMSSNSDSLRKQISGNFTGTTDEIFQWVACKWGIDVNIVRADAVVESTWHQSTLGDYTNNQSLCPPGTWNGSSCYQSYGVLQIKYEYFKTEWPMSKLDTAFNAEFVMGWLRNCYEGWADYLYNVTPSPGYPRYHAGDMWGCLGFWFSGSWYTQGAISYIQKVQQDYNQKPWLQPGF